MTSSNERAFARMAPLATYAPVRGAKAWLASRSSGARMHAGVDLAAPSGKVARSPESGVVLLAGDADTMRAVGGWRWRGYGPQIVLLRGESGRTHLLAHLRDVAVREGEELHAGQPVGLVSSLAHVHWEVRAGDVPPARRSVLEIALSPLDWLDGRDRRWRYGVDPCPKVPGATLDTPWPCRPGRARGSPMPPEDFDSDTSTPVPVDRVRVIEEPMLVTARRPVTLSLATLGIAAAVLWLLLGRKRT